jgi:uridine phosphorylase
MRGKDYPILEFDDNQEALIEPRKIIKPIDIPEHCVLAFFKEVIDKPFDHKDAKPIYHIKSEMKPIPVYEIRVDDKRLAVTHPGLGAPFAAALLEELIALGCRKFIACGGAGVLKKDIGRGMVVVVNSAVRDEGVSYHYLAPSREVHADSKVIAHIERVLRKHNVDYLVGKTWTTDGFYRETKNKISLRKAEGCLTVEMEASALLAVSEFRNVEFGQILYAGDDVSGEEWDLRYCDESASHREKLFWLAVESCLSL